MVTYQESQTKITSNQVYKPVIYQNDFKYVNNHNIINKFLITFIFYFKKKKKKKRFLDQYRITDDLSKPSKVIFIYCIMYYLRQNWDWETFCCERQLRKHPWLFIKSPIRGWALKCSRDQRLVKLSFHVFFFFFFSLIGFSICDYFWKCSREISKILLSNCNFF